MHPEVLFQERDVDEFAFCEERFGGGGGGGGVGVGVGAVAEEGVVAFYGGDGFGAGAFVGGGAGGVGVAVVGEFDAGDGVAGDTQRGEGGEEGQEGEAHFEGWSIFLLKRENWMIGPQHLQGKD